MSDLAEQLAAIKALEAAATEGPWTVDRAPSGWPGTDSWLVKDASGTGIAATGTGDLAPPNNAEFIAHAREDLPNLVRALELALPHLPEVVIFEIAELFR